MATLPAIFDEDVNALVSDMQTQLQTALGRSFAPADVEMLLINAFCYQLQLYNITGNNAFRQNLVDYATGSMLDFLGALVGVTRLPAAPAMCTLEFNLVPGHTTETIPVGTRVASRDGAVIFQTDEDVLCPSDATQVNVTATAQTAGTDGNNYAKDYISLILDPKAYISTAQNTDVTRGGSDIETDDELRERIKLAPSAFSVAGPAEAYIYWAKTASATIADVACVTTQPGEVTLYPLCIGGAEAPQTLRDQIAAICSADNIRPQNDSVLVANPDRLTYAIDVNIITYTGTTDDTVKKAVEDSLQNYVDKGLNKLGVDVVVSQIIAACMVDGVYDIRLNSPTADMVVAANQYAQNTGINVNPITEHNDG